MPNANDGSRRPPRLFVAQAMWGMKHLPAERALELVAEAGFDGIDLDIPDVAGREDHWRGLLERHRLGVGLQGPFINTLAELDHCAAVVKRMGSPYLDAQVGDYFLPEREARALLQSLVESADMPLLLQTHRGKVTQDLLRTVDHCRAIPALRLNLDLSHYFVAGGLGPEALSPRATEAFEVLLGRTAMIDARISNGHQVQVDDDACLPHFERLWKRAMRKWLETAGPGDVFVFRPELGPPPYAIVTWDGREISDRWEQSKRLAALGRRLWSEVSAGKTLD